MRTCLSLFSILALCFFSRANAEEHEHDHDHGEHHEEEVAAHDDHGEAIDWSDGKGFSIGGFLFPELFASGVFGDSTADPADLAVADHDPQENAVLQSFHIAGVVNVNDWLTGFANFEGASSADGTFNGVMEEGFAHLHPTDWLAIGGGQFLNAFGFQNERHVHAWDFVDQYLVNGRMLNEGELTTQGGEVILDLPTPWKSTLTVGGGGVRSHHGDEAHGDEEAEFEADGGNFSDWVLTGNYRADYGEHDHMAGTASFAIGENGFGETTQVYGIGHEVLWNPHTSVIDAKGVVTDSPPGNGFGAGSLRWRTEAMFRNVEAISGGGHHGEEEEHAHTEESHNERRHADLDEFGVYSMLQYGLCDRASLAFRAEWVSGISEMGLDERWRLSPALSTYLNEARTIQTRLQYNYDHSNDFGGEHSIWFQIGISWGGYPGGHGHEH